MLAQERSARRGEVSSRLDLVSASGIRRFFELIATTDGVISLGVGEPDFVTPNRMRQAAVRSIEDGLTAYTSNWGLLELRQAIARQLERLYGVSYMPNVVLAGGTFVSVPTTAAGQFQLQAADLEARITPRSKAILLGYPANPTGAVMDRPALEA